MSPSNGLYDVGGVLLPQPFKARRLGHFALWQTDMEMARRIYVDVLGFRETDVVRRDGQTNAVFTSHGTDHHSLAAINASTAEGVRKAHYENGVFVNQISFQVGTLEEVTNAHNYFAERQLTITRLAAISPAATGRSTCSIPTATASNSTTAWSRSAGTAGASRPPPCAGGTQRLRAAAAVRDGRDSERGGQRDRSRQRTPSGRRTAPRLLCRRRHAAAAVQGHEDWPGQSLVADLDRSERFYTELLGLTKIEEVDYRGHRCVYLRCGTDHHCIGLFPVALRREARPQSRDHADEHRHAGRNLQAAEGCDRLPAAEGAAVHYSIPFELHPGIDYAAHAIMPDGHMIQLYHAMEQVGWDGRPRPAAQRRRVAPDWPQAIEAAPDTYADQVMQGPLG
jgi:catechol 2,3-dioxygenase-like lactoylglutathione lyase family enzyme